MGKNRRVFGYFEIVFDMLYLCIAGIAGAYILSQAKEPGQILAGSMILVLGGGDAFHLVPRILVVLTGKEEWLSRALGFGKLVTSVTMTAFYVLLWHIGLLIFSPEGMALWTGTVYALAALRVLLCLFPQNRWFDKKPPVKWGIYRNIPFFLLGAVVSGLYFVYRGSAIQLSWMWMAILLSFVFYIPVVLWVNRSPKLGMLMFPKTCAYIWIVFMCLTI
ncbi:MAG TPA: hypothetical protein GXX75_09660 [Clostridiales bacterium]|nr:hypothetical protein [Clostridiales bacterium]